MRAKNRIVILTEASSSIGFGHLRRTISLAELLSVRVDVVVWILKESHGFQGLLPHSSNWQIFYGTEIDWEEIDCDVVISDLEQVNHRRFLLESKRENIPAVALDWFSTECLPDVTINLFDQSGAMRNSYLESGREEDYFEGPEFAIIRKDIIDQKNRLAAGNGLGSILVTFGGADPANRTLDAVRMLEDFVEAKIEIVIGPLVPESTEISIRDKISESMEVVRNPKNFSSMLARADLVLCSGGGGLLESLFLGKPTVVFPQNESERRHAEFHKSRGACVLDDELAEVLSNSDLRKILSKNAAKSVDGNGAMRIHDIAIGLLV